MTNNIRQKKIPGLILLLVFFLFSISILAMLLSGAGIYRSTVQSGQERFETRTVIQYLTTRIRQADSREQLLLQPFGDSQALILLERVDGETYQTLVYCYDGWLRELFCHESSCLAPGDGEKILQLQSLTMHHRINGIQVEALLPDDRALSFFVALRSSQEVLP